MMAENTRLDVCDQPVYFPSLLTDLLGAITTANSAFRRWKIWHCRRRIIFPSRIQTESAIRHHDTTRIATLLFHPGRSDLDSMYYSTDTWILGWPRISASSNLSHSWLGRVCMYRILGPYIGSIAWCGIREWINSWHDSAFNHAPGY